MKDNHYDDFLNKDYTTNFYQLYKLGKLTIDDIDDYIVQWHTGDSKLSIYEFLGLTCDQYVKFVETNTILLET